MKKKITIWLLALYMIYLLYSSSAFGATITSHRAAFDQMGKSPQLAQNFINSKSDFPISSVATTQQMPKVPVKKFLVQGKVSGEDGTPRSGLIVKAFDRNIGAEDILLGQATTDKQGYYLIYYTFKSKTAADLVIKVYQDNQLLQVSDVIFDAAIKETKDFVIPDKGQKFQNLKHSLDPLLQNKVVE